MILGFPEIDQITCCMEIVKAMVESRKKKMDDYKSVVVNKNSI